MSKFVMKNVYKIFVKKEVKFALSQLTLIVDVLRLSVSSSERSPPHEEEVDIKLESLSTLTSSIF